MLTASAIPILGVVVNGVRAQWMPYGKYAYGYRTTREPSA